MCRRGVGGSQHLHAPGRSRRAGRKPTGHANFGQARAADDASVSQSRIVTGTPMYMAPEQARGETLDHRADLFSLGSVLYTMCSGRPPFRANSMVAVLKRGMRSQVEGEGRSDAN
jgi:serine/threonine protein kinase